VARPTNGSSKVATASLTGDDLGRVTKSEENDAGARDAATPELISSSGDPTKADVVGARVWRVAFGQMSRPFESRNFMHDHATFASGRDHRDRYSLSDDEVPRYAEYRRRFSSLHSPLGPIVTDVGTSAQRPPAHHAGGCAHPGHTTGRTLSSPASTPGWRPLVRQVMQSLVRPPHANAARR
jgi:hypothetical protein